MLKKLILSLVVFMAVPSIAMDNNKKVKSSFKVSAATHKNMVRAGYAWGVGSMLFTPLTVVMAPITVPAGTFVMGATALYDYAMRANNYVEEEINEEIEQK